MITSVNRIITARDYALREGCENVFQRIQKMINTVKARGGPLLFIASPVPSGFSVQAEIEFGQWIAHCSCGGAEMVDPAEPIFYCFGCGNRENGGLLRPVIFPAERETIEQLILERPVDDARGLDDLDRAYQARPVLLVQVEQTDGTSALLPLSRSWLPGESVEEIRRQNEPVYAWRAALADGE